MSESPLTPLSDSTSPAHQKKINQHDSFDSIYDGLDDQDPIGVGVYEGTRKNTRGFNGNSSAEKEEMGKEDGEISDTSGDGYKEDQEMRDSSFGSDIEEEQKEGETASSILFR
ncbi:hypothetical protein JCM5353_001347 [Sporobolomyces roseus]